MCRGCLGFPVNTKNTALDLQLGSVPKVDVSSVPKKPYEWWNRAPIDLVGFSRAESTVEVSVFCRSFRQKTKGISERSLDRVLFNGLKTHCSRIRSNSRNSSGSCQANSFSTSSVLGDSTIRHLPHGSRTINNGPITM